MALPVDLFSCSCGLGAAGLGVTTPIQVCLGLKGISPVVLNWKSPRQTGTVGHHSWSQGLGEKKLVCPTEWESFDKNFLDCIEHRRPRRS